MKRCTLYRHFGSDGRLLYVGISLNALGRLEEHSIQAEWFPLIATVTLEHYSSIGEAREAERSAIIHEMPIHNVKHAHRLHYRFTDELIVQDVL